MEYKRFVLSVVIGMIFILTPGFFYESIASQQRRSGSNWRLNINPNLRLSYNKVNNSGDLKSSEDDKLGYASYIYNIPITIKYRANTTFFINLISEGPSHYAAPLKDIEPYIEGARVRKDGDISSVLYPGINEVWLKFYPTLNFSLQIGQASYIVGNGYALGGQYNNYGVTFAYERGNKIRARLRYSILDVENRLYGINNDTLTKWDMGRSDDSVAYMVASDVEFKVGNHTFQPYVGFLYDHTLADNRSQHGYFANINQSFRARRDRVVTLGLSAKLEFSYATFEIDGAKNFGKTDSDTEGWDDIEHKGYLIHTALNGHLGIFTPRAKVVVASGNKVDVGDPAKFINGTLKRTDNRAFTVFSPLNTNLVDSYAHIATVPVVAMAGGYPMNYGIRRPGTFNDPHVWENIITYNLGLNILPLDEIFIMLDFWHLTAMESGIGRNSSGNWENLSKELGDELDIYTTYSFTKSITVGLHGGYFRPGKYYKTKRNESNLWWNNTLSQTVRSDGSADNVHQMEVFFTYKF